MSKTRFTSALAISLVLVAGTAIAQGNYTASDTGCSSFSAIAGGTSTRLSTVSGCDDCTELVSLPRAFNWFGDTAITAVQVASNGQININSTDGNSNCCTADPVVIGGNYTKPRIAL
ncbi:MAG: hypothetical protein GY716_06985, partial [bacterium]|nr:hypothetical protein [bacterium]